MKTRPPFHLAIPVNNLNIARAFYGELLGCDEGRSDVNWIDFNFFGHQLVVHKTNQDKVAANEKLAYNPVDRHQVPVPHFGVVLDWAEWESLAERLQSKGIQFVIQPDVRFKGQIGEQGTMFLFDPFTNALEFKAFRNPEELFKKQDRR